LTTVGVFDSGVGGLSVLRALREALPQVDFVYFADNAFAPYGERPAEWVTERSAAITRWLLERHHIDALVVACNTATAAGIDSLRQAHPALPIVGVEPALKPAAALTQTRQVGVLATRGTLASERYARLRERLRQSHPAVQWHERAAVGLAAAIETGDTAATQRLTQEHVSALLAQAPALDTLVLGCTHYPFAAGAIAQAAGTGVRLIDTADAVARRTRDVLDATPTGQGKVTLLASGDAQALATAAQRWLGWTEGAEQVGNLR